MRYALLFVVTFAAIGQQVPATGGRGQGQGGGANPGRGAASVRWEPWSAMRSAAGTILGWQVGAAAESLGQATLFDALQKTDTLGLANLEGSAAQKVNLEIPKFVLPALFPGEITAIKDRLFALNVRMAAFRVPEIGADAGKLFAFAQNVGIGLITVEKMPQALSAVDQLANEHNVSVAVCGAPAAGLAAIGSLSKRIGLCADASALSASSLTDVKDRLMVLRLGDAQGAGLAPLLRARCTASR